MEDTVTLTLAADQVTPVRAYAALRSFATKQSSFLFESLSPSEPRGRYSIVGYRAESESLYPAGSDALAMLVDELNVPAASAGAGAHTENEALASRLSRATVGFINYDAVHPLHKIKPWESEGPVARLLQGSTVVLFDHHHHTLTVAGPTRASVNRATWEMNHGPELRLLRAPDPGAAPEHVDVSVDDETFLSRVGRAKDHIARGEIAEVVLARTFRTPVRNADPFDIYRALRLLSPSPYLFFFDFVETPMVPPQPILGASFGALVGSSDEKAGEGVSPGERIRAAFPAAALSGSPRARAAQIIRDLEAGPRGIYGGAVGYILPDGEIGLVVANRPVILENAFLDVTAGVTIVEGSDPAAVVRQTRNEARAALAAIRAAQDAADAREAADAAKKAKEEAKAAEAARALSTEKAGDEAEGPAPIPSGEGAQD